MAVSFETDIGSLLRGFNIESVVPFGFNRSLHEDIKTHAQNICDRLADRSMPCNDLWVPRASPEIHAVGR